MPYGNTICYILSHDASRRTASRLQLADGPRRHHPRPHDLDGAITSVGRAAFLFGQRSRAHL